MAAERLNKYLASCGVASRRAADEMITAGRVRVNGRIVRELGVRVDPAVDQVQVDRKQVRTERRTLILMMNKPRGVVTTSDDPYAVKNLKPWLQRYRERIYPVGRLDKDSEGLLILTNDGELTQYLTHPKYHIEKEYRVSVEGKWTDGIAQRFMEGIPLDDGPTAPAEVFHVNEKPERTRFSIILKEGRCRQIRRMCEAEGLRVIKLRRERIGPVRMTELRVGQIKTMSYAEQRHLWAEIRRINPEAARKRAGKRNG